MFIEGIIKDVTIRPLKRYIDQRGSLVEIFRNDELGSEFYPVMSYISMTNPGIVRGPHEHIEQADLFGFIGPSNFNIYLWDNRKNSPTYLTKQIFTAGENNPVLVLVPPGVVHAYKNIGDSIGMVANYPNKLFMGKNRIERVDEIRHENDPQTIFKID